jgi:hypothetical protein
MSFLKILFFSGWVTINAEPVDIGNTPVMLEAPETLDVVTSGAHIKVDVTNMVSGEDLFEIRDELDKLFPENCVVAVVSGDDGKEAIFDRLGSSIGNSSVHLTLGSDIGVGTDAKFSRISISSCQPIDQTTVIWVNFKQ